VKYIGAFYLALSGLVIFWNFWTRWVPRKELTTSQILRKLGSAYGVFYLTFFTTYVALFYIHLSVLTNAGPHDSVMTSAFQASLKVSEMKNLKLIDWFRNARLLKEINDCLGGTCIHY
jgi:dolichyl-phosphate-mannose-protein mannosyltransferase